MWVDNKAYRAMKKRQSRCKYYKNNPTETSKRMYKQALNNFTKESRRSRFKFEKKRGEQIKTDIRNRSRTKDAVTLLLLRIVLVLLLQMIMKELLF